MTNENGRPRAKSRAEHSWRPRTTRPVAALIGLLKDDSEREVRRSAAGALGEMGPAAASAVPCLRKALRGEGGGWWVAADAIGKIGGPDAVPALVEALESKDDDVRLTAIKRLGELGGVASSAAKALEKARKDDPRESNRKAAAEALKKITQGGTPPASAPSATSPSAESTTESRQNCKASCSALQKHSDSAW